jgi:chaperonin GroEL (HSP60 family)
MSNNLEIIDRDSFRTTGENVRKFNIHAARLLKSIIQSTFGPQGNEKIYIDIIGESTYTKDGATFLRKIDVQHPAAKVLIDATNTVDNEVGDGTLTTAILAATLLEKSEEMMDTGISPATIASGFDNGLKYALELLDSISYKVDNKNKAIIEKIAQSCLGTKIIFSSLDQDELKNILGIIVKAVDIVYSNSKNSLDIDDIKIEEKIGNFIESKLIDGIVIDKSTDNKAMPRMIENARILLLDEELESKITRTESQITVNSPNQMMLFSNAEKDMVRNKVQQIVNCGANVVFSRKGIDKTAQEILSKAGIMSVKRVKENDLNWLEKATGGRITKDLEDEEMKNNLGNARSVYEKRIADDKMIFVEGCLKPRAVTILIRANSKMVMDEVHRALQSTLVLVKRFIQSPSIVVGGGSCEALIAYHIREIANKTPGTEQVVLRKFAESLEEIPLTLARNCGLNAMDSEIKLRSQLSRKVLPGKIRWVGVNSSDRCIGELDWEVIELKAAKEQILNSAVEVGRLLINIDNIIVKKLLMNTHTHEDGTEHSHANGDKKHDHYFDKLGKQQRPHHHYY